MLEILKKRTKLIFIVLSVLLIICYFSYHIYKKNSEYKLNVEIYSIEYCPLCNQVKDSLPKKLKDEFGNTVNIKIINVDDKANEQEYEHFINSINAFKDEHRNNFPIINVENYFTIVGYDYYYDSEIINDIYRMDAHEHLGKKLENSRYMRRD